MESHDEVLGVLAMTQHERELLIAVARAVTQSGETPRSIRHRIIELARLVMDEGGKTDQGRLHDLGDQDEEK